MSDRGTSTTTTTSEPEHPSPGDATSEPPAKRPRRSYVACRRCHSHKIKCSGETPCRSCQQSNNAGECVYPIRDRKVVVPESFIKKLEAENKALKAQLAEGARADARSSPSSSSGPQPPASPPESLRQPATPPDASEIANPLFESRIQLVHDQGSAAPVYIGEAACAVFGNRLRQHLDPSAAATTTAGAGHARYFKHALLTRMMSAEFALPDRVYANVLVRMAVRFVGQDYHFSLGRSFRDRLQRTYRASSFDDPVWLCKLFAVFALGELYSNRRSRAAGAADQAVPGTHFFLRAMSLFQDLYEEASLPYIETLILLSFYSHALNRTTTAYSQIGIAFRLSLVLGLHRSVSSEAGATTRVERENRVRTWWTVYVLDRLYSSKLGHPVTIRDADTDAELPSMDGLAPGERDEFCAPDHLVANIQLSRIAGHILGDIYSVSGAARAHAFLHSVHKVLTSLRAWGETLPLCLRLDPAASPPYASRAVASLHLQFNQCIILTTRPVLLHVFKTRFRSLRVAVEAESPAAAAPASISPMTQALAEACVQAARKSNELLAQLWIEGSIATFGYFDAHYIFSSTLIIMMSAVLNPSVADSDAIQTAWNLLRSMRDDGNVPACQYYQQLVQLKKAIDQAHGGLGVHAGCTPRPVVASEEAASSSSPCTRAPGSVAASRSSSSPGAALGKRRNPDVPEEDGEEKEEGTLRAGPAADSIGGGAVLDDPFILDFLTQPDAQWNDYDICL